MGRKAADDGKIDFFKSITQGVDGIGLVSEMEEVRWVPTMLSGYNRATKLGGHPLGCMSVIHGPNQVGKSVIALAIAESMRRHGHVSVIYDTEYAGEKEWYSAITPRSGLKHPRSLDELISDVRTMLDNLIAGKKARKKAERIPEEVGICFVVDTLTELLPQQVLDQINKEGIDRMYPIQAMYLSVFFKAILGDIFRTNSSLVVVLQERQNIGAKPNQKQNKPAGGKAVQYGNRMRIAVTHSKKIAQGEKIVGWQAFAEVQNNKITGSSKEPFWVFTSNGRGDAPKGIDLVRDTIEEAKYRGFMAPSKDKKYIVFKVGKKRVLEIRGGWADAREYLREQPEHHRELIEILAE